MAGRKISQIIFLELFVIFIGLGVGMIPSLYGLFTNPHFHNLSVLNFESLFIPFIIASIFLTVFFGWMGEKKDLNPVFMTGTALSIAGLALVSLTNLAFDFPILLLVTLYMGLFLLGGGTGILLTVITCWFSDLFPVKSFSANLLLWSGNGFGMILSVGLVEFSLILHKWWLSPLLVLMGLFIFFLLIDFFNLYPKTVKHEGKEINFSFFLFFLLAVIYGFLSASFDFWNIRFSLIQSDFEFYFLLFWIVATLSRILFALLYTFSYPLMGYLLLPVVVIFSAFVSDSQLYLAFSVEVLLPITLVWSQRIFTSQFSLVTSLGISGYFLGVGIGQWVELSSLMIALGGTVLLLLHAFVAKAFPAKEKQ